MKKILIISFILFSELVFSQTEFPYGAGEHAAYKLYFGSIFVGHAELEVKEITSIKGVPSFHVIGKGRTNTFFDIFFKVRDVYQTFIDSSTLLPVQFKRDVNEGGYLINQNYVFNHKENKVITKDSIFFIPENTQDMLSAFFYARTFKKEIVLAKTNMFEIPIFIDEDNSRIEIRYLRNEIINTKWGKINCMVFQPIMQEGRVFENGEEMKIWVSDDSNHLLIKVEAKIWAGRVGAMLEAYEGLKHPFSIVKE